MIQAIKILWQRAKMAAMLGRRCESLLNGMVAAGLSRGVVVLTRTGQGVLVGRYTVSNANGQIRDVDIADAALDFDHKDNLARAGMEPGQRLN